MARAERAHSRRLANWMALLPEEALARRVWEVALPGSHDSAAHAVAFWHTLRASYASLPTRRLAGRVLRAVAPVAAPLGWIIRGWAQTQALDIAGQLAAGVRVLDLRVYAWHSSAAEAGDDEAAAASGDGLQYALSHSFPTGEALEDALDAVLAFLAEHPTELVVVRLTEDGEPFRAPHLLMAMLDNCIAPALARHAAVVAAVSSVELERPMAELIADGRRLVLLWEGSLDALPAIDTLPSYMLEVKLAALDARVSLLAESPPALFSEIDFCLTPSQPLIRSRYLPWQRCARQTYGSLASLCEAMNISATEYVTAHGAALASSASFLSFDFVDPDLMACVIYSLYAIDCRARTGGKYGTLHALCDLANRLASAATAGRQLAEAD
ncbi:uncharacterized protein AMSG_05279 [Thecamonas trahens ATCC 50062]|uniref:Phosphatidylinositol-specific phospholipase C X domain-containing protein n=1 Tax=Thecamonas trahens ATCC 50062 TaxID=461836 RepID=A0A0L0DAA0_THETB|nr:hypothetical protein AMSG_05279 [Thecamonas trahens ATCC 50062]KNC49284.1 hypothetical protein AMSG_05279 [Thecamonas trahens ATCC 50062]|eukprot:XP_013757998.1 hypothetical protein AMSG_05279 [Thecamonas trahens ATCC 50062]